MDNLKSVEVIKKKYNKRDLFAITIDNVFSEEECKEWIKLTDERGYIPALVNMGGGREELLTDIRNNDRCIIDSEEMAAKIYNRIEKFIPSKFNTFDVVSLNERLRFLRYGPGQEFKMHRDGQYVRTTGPKSGETSFITLQLYLNNVSDGGSGGETTFFIDDPEKFKKKPKVINVIPKTGMVLLFQHNITHQGSPVNKGIKYVMRTDVMYK